MEIAKNTEVVTPSGKIARVIALSPVSGDTDVQVKFLDSGRKVWIPAEKLAKRA